MRLFFGAIALLALGCTEHPPLDVPKVELQRFQGGWYELAKLPRVTQQGCMATTATYRLKSATELDVYSECHEGSLDGPVRSMAARAVVTDPSEPAKLSLDFGGFFGDYWIIDVDADYQLAAVGHPSRDYLWMLSRSPSVEPAEFDALVERVRKKDFDVGALELTSQHDETDGRPLPGPSLPSPSDHGCALAAGRPGSTGALGWVFAFSFVVACFRARVAALRKTRARRILASSCMTGICLSLPVSASASTVFPEVVRSHWGVQGELPVPGRMGCRLCHTDEVGGAQNLRMSFGRLIHEYYGVTKKNAAELETALDDIQEMGWDSDGDGASDYDEIAVDATNPNDPSARRPPDAQGEGGAGPGPAVPHFVELPSPVGHGCSVREMGRADGAGGLAVGSVLFGAALLRSRVRRHAVRRGSA